MDPTRTLLLCGALGIVLLGAILYTTSPPSRDVELRSDQAQTPPLSETESRDPTSNEGAQADLAQARPKGAKVGAPDPSSEQPPTVTLGKATQTEDPVGEEPEEDLPSEHEPLAIGALDFPIQKELDADDPNYNPRIEAQQAFAPMEQDLLGAEPLDSVAWKQALEKHRVRNLSVSKRAAFLRGSGYPDEAMELMAEWSRVYGTWQARAYGRSGAPGYKSPPP